MGMVLWRTSGCQIRVLWININLKLIPCSGIDAGIKLRPTKEELEKIGPAFNRKWDEFYANAPDKPVIWTGTMAQ